MISFLNTYVNNNIFITMINDHDAKEMKIMKEMKPLMVHALQDDEEHAPA